MEQPDEWLCRAPALQPLVARVGLWSLQTQWRARRRSSPPCPAWRRLWCSSCRREQAFDTQLLWLRCSACGTCYGCGERRTEPCQECRRKG
jgi:hypothetical protein